MHRDAFDIPEEITYFNCAYMSPQARSVRDAGQRALARKAAPWEIEAHHFFEESDEVRGRFAGLIGADPEGIALLPSVSYGIGVAAANLPLTRGQTVLITADQFPSNVYPWRVLAQSVGATVTTVPWPEDGDWTRALLTRLEDRPAIVALPNCHWTNGSLIDLERIGEACHDLSIPLVVDGTQSIGAFPFDVARIKPAFVVAAGYKWLLGPYSTALMYVAPAYRHGLPLEQSWMARKGAENFARLVDYTDAVVDTAARFDVGERSNFMLMPMVNAALALIESWGVASIAEDLGAYNRALAEGAQALGFAVPPEHLRVPHIVGLRYPGSLPADLGPALRARNVLVSIRGESIRVAPHLYNTEGERARFLEILADLL